MSNLAVLKALSQLADRIQTLQAGNSAPEETVEKQLKRLAKEQYKANTLLESQTEQMQRTIGFLQEQVSSLAKQQEQQVQVARLDVIRALLPVLDSIEIGIKSGVSQIKQLQASSPEAARLLIAWLNGQRLLRERLLKLLEAEGVIPIVAVGQPFDPYQHVVVKTVHRPDRANGIIVAVERSGYQSGDTVLRYADVIVNKVQQ